MEMEKPAVRPAGEFQSVNRGGIAGPFEKGRALYMGPERYLKDTCRERWWNFAKYCMLSTPARQYGVLG